MFREDCWESYTTLKLCTPQYEQCLILMRKNCSGVFSRCIENHHTSTSSTICRQHVQSFTETIGENESSYVENILDRITSQEERNKEMCDVSIFEHHNFLLLNLSLLAKSRVDKLPHLILSFCQCPEQLEVKFSRTELFPQSRQSSITLHYWYGGFRNFKCWREVDQYLAETLCGRKTSFLINHEWAKREDCRENPIAFNCSIKFAEKLNETLENSETPLFCSVYVEIVGKITVFFENASFGESSIPNYKIVYTDSDVATNLIYRSDELYLFNHSNQDIDFKCFDGKRTLNSYTYFLHYCEELNQDGCHEQFVRLLKEVGGLSDDCVSELMPEKNFVEQLCVLLWKHKGKLFLFGLIAVILTCCKKLRDWIAKELGIRLCMCLTRKFDAATIYFNDLIPNDGTCQDTTILRTNQILHADDDENDGEEHGQLLPVDDQHSSEVTDANCNADPNSNNYIGDIQQETDWKTPKNNQTPMDPLLNTVSTESLVKEKSSPPKEKPKSLSAFKNVCSSFWNMSASMGSALNVRLIIPGINYVRQKTFGSRSNSEMNQTNFSAQVEHRIVIEGD